MFALQGRPSVVADAHRDAIRWTAWYVIVLCGSYTSLWGSAADHAYEISARFSPPRWPLSTDRAEFRRFTRHVVLGMFVLFTGMYVALMLSAPWIAGIATVVFYVIFVRVSFKFIWPKPKSPIGKLTTRLAVIVFLLAMGWFTIFFGAVLTFGRAAARWVGM